MVPELNIPDEHLAELADAAIAAANVRPQYRHHLPRTHYRPRHRQQSCPRQNLCPPQDPEVKAMSNQVLLKHGGREKRFAPQLSEIKVRRQHSWQINFSAPKDGSVTLTVIDRSNREKPTYKTFTIPER